LENHGGMMVREENPWLINQGSLVIPPVESSGSKLKEWVKGMRIWPCKVFLFILVSDFYVP
jgi:hypothetical protein